MKAFLRDNPTIAFGLGLPLLLVLVFLLVSGIPALLVAPPQYDVLYATEYYNYPYGVKISVVDRKVQVIYQSGSRGYQVPHLWRYSPKNGGVREIGLILPPGLEAEGNRTMSPEEAAKVTTIEVPELAGLTVDASTIAPDGYEFTSGSTRYADDIFTGLFYSSRYRNEAVLTKNGRSIRLPNADNRYYSFSTHFIGWVMPP
jgi:hypothetical protein